jgi:hypothetical protein
MTVVVAIVITAGVGCGSPQPVLGPAVEATAPFTAQVAAVRRGVSSRIETNLPPTAAEWESLRGLPGLRELVLRAGVARDDEAAILATLPDVERLVLRASPLTDAGFLLLAGCPRLRDLNVPRAACTAAGVAALAAAPNLRSLRLGGSALAGGATCTALVTLPGLRSLHLIDVEIGDAGLATLAECPALRNLYLDGAGVSDEAWAGYFARHPRVHVHVDQVHHDRDPSRHEH